MSSLSPKLQLKRNDGTDPFLRTDFVDNWNKLDAAPGVHVCTSDTRPTWGADQAGRSIIPTDEKRIQYWDGSAFQEPRTAVPYFAGGAIFDATIAKNSAPVYNVLNFTVSRPCSLAIMMNVTLSCDSRYTQSIVCRANYDGGDLLLGAYSDAARFTGNSSDTSADAQLTVPVLASVASVTKGSHQIKCKVQTGAYNTSIILRGIKTICFVGLYNGSQSL